MGWPTMAQLEDEINNTFYVDYVRVWARDDADWVDDIPYDSVKDDPSNL